MFSDDQACMMELVTQTPQLPLCQHILQLDDNIHLRTLLLLAVVDYAKCGGQEDKGLSIYDINRFYPEDWECEMLRHGLMTGESELIRKDYLTYKCNDGMADNTMFVLTEKTKSELLMNYRPYHLARKSAQDPNIIPHTGIATKHLHYNAAEGKEIERLSNIISKEGFATIQERLASKGLRTGVAVLLSGGPGTGKTETVRQLARESGRDLFMVDISSIKSKWVGESEHNTQAIFDRYKSLCKASEVKPILFINECDAILGKRMENAK